MTHNFNKTYYEIYAALILCKINFLKEPFSIDWIVDSPDIQSGFTGIEVTNDMPTDTGSQTALWNDTYGLSKDKKIEIIDKRDKKKKFSREFSEDKMSMDFPVHNEEILLQAIHKKQEKYDSYKKFDEMCLFVFSRVFMLDRKENDEIRNILNKVEFDFSTIFIMSFNKIFEWKEGNVNDYTLTNLEIKNIHENTVRINERYFDSKGNRIL